MITEIKEQNKSKSIIRVILILLGILIMISVIWIGIYIIFLGLYIIIMSFLIKDKSIQVYSDRFELKGKSILRILDSKEVFEYSKIRKIEFSESYNDIFKSVLKSMVIDDFALIGNSGFGTHSKPDTITIIFKNDLFRVINRLGTKEQFLKCFKSILEEINKIK